ncbi:MAG: sugar transporter [Rhodobacterales bacterium]|nr:MAG: sugar transporter [Rhodobacterales bacterium]
MRIFAVMAMVASLAACGNAAILTGETDAGNVTIVAVTRESIATANASPYRPRALPAIFSHSAGTGGAPMGSGAVPEPAYSPESRPVEMATRLPEPFTPGPYTIGVGDVLLLSTPNSASTVEALAGLLAAQSSRQGYTVQDDGAIAIPEVGRISLAGLTLEEAEAAIFQALVGNQFDPTFSLEIAEFNSQSVNIGGAVKQAASVPITLQTPTLSKAITAAGGVSLTDRDYATIRLYRDGSIYQVPMSAYMSDPKVQGMALKDGDSIFVDTAFDLDKASAYFTQQIQLANFRQAQRETALAQLKAEVALRREELSERRSNYLSKIELDAVKRDYVYVAGEVGVQSRFTLPFERKASLADALFTEASGVPSEKGSLAHLYVIRAAAKSNEVVAWHLDASNAANLVLATRFELRPNDVVFVLENPVRTAERLFSMLGTGAEVVDTINGL